MLKSSATIVSAMSGKGVSTLPRNRFQLSVSSKGSEHIGSKYVYNLPLTILTQITKVKNEIRQEV